MMRAIVLREFGAATVMSLGTSSKPKARGGHVVIRVKASGVNPADLLQRQGRYPPPSGASDLLGLEVAGTIDEVGEGVEKFRVGDPVMALLDGGGYAEYAEANSGCVLPLPKGFSFVEGAAMMEAQMTAWQCLTTHQRPKQGDVVLIHAAGGAVGMAAALLAKRILGCKVITTSSADKAAKLQSMGFADIAITRKSEGTCFADDVISAVGKDSVSFILDPVFGGSYLQEDVNVLQVDGTVVVIGLLGGVTPTFKAHTALFKRTSIIFSTLRSRSTSYKLNLVASFEKEVQLGEGMRPTVHCVLPADQVVAAHQMMEKSENFGKIVLEW